MKHIIVKISFCCFGLLLLANDALALELRLRGSCAGYFVGENQLKPFDGKIRCIVSTDNDLSKNTEKKVIVTRSYKKSSGAVIVSKRQHQLEMYNNRNLSKKLYLKGFNGRARYKIELIEKKDDFDIQIPELCMNLVSELEEEANKIRACQKDSDCGQILKGTSCGCTRDWVARKNIDPSNLYMIINKAISYNCSDELPINSTCDCPSAKSFACIQGQCTWNYSE